MDDPGEQLIEALARLEEVAGEMTAQDAAEQLDGATLQEFWRSWPRSSAWAGALWRVLNADLEGAAGPVGDPELEDLGGSG